MTDQELRDLIAGVMGGGDIQGMVADLLETSVAEKSAKSYRIIRGVIVPDEPAKPKPTTRRYRIVTKVVHRDPVTKRVDHVEVVPELEWGEDCWRDAEGKLRVGKGPHPMFKDEGG